MLLNSNYARTRVKICGMSDPDNVRQVIACGVDAIGMILHANSPRKISVEQAKAIRQVVPAFVSLVGVFVDCDVEAINHYSCLLYTSPSPRDQRGSRMPSSA